jgi:hypothetical protein
LLTKQKNIAAYNKMTYRREPKGSASEKYLNNSNALSLAYKFPEMPDFIGKNSFFCSNTNHKQGINVANDTFLSHMNAMRAR